MTDGRNPPELRVASADDLVLVTCPVCANAIPVPVRSLVRGTSYLCDKCGAYIETTPKSSIPTVNIEARRGAEVVAIKAIKRIDGIWVFLDDGEKSILVTLDHDSDRAIAIVIGSMIESRLQRAILAKCYRDKKIEARMFQPAGPLGSFSSKIDLARLIGLITPEAHLDLLVLKDIRNAFAHDLSIANFQSQPIKDKAANFQLINTYVVETDLAPDGTQKFVNLDPSTKPVIFALRADARKKLAKDRYLLTSQLLTIRFATCESNTAVWPLI